ncbi:MAG: DNA repair protein RecO [bacterium]|nr:DNA repair protein RecO [bacterium]
MVTQITVTGMVLAAMPVGDYDKRLVILTKERGKISAFAKGARKPNSALLACSQPFVFGEFNLYAGRNSYNVMNSNISNYFPEIKEDLEAVSYACYFAELVEQVTHENNDEVEVLKLLYQTMRALTKTSINNKLIRYIFELKIMSINGYTPQVFECVSCGETENVHLFSFSRGGLVCSNCKKDAGELMGLEGSTIYTMQFIIATPVEKLYTFTVNETVLRELKKVMERYMKMMIDRKFKSLEILELL